MASTPDVVTGLAADLLAAHAKDVDKDGRLGKIARYLRGDQDLPYAPRGATAEYRSIARKSITNWLPLISDTYSKSLWVDGYRPAKSATNSPAWDYWQANGLDARQSVVHRGALDYGVAYALVLKGKPAPYMRPLPALKTLALYEDDEDEFPTVGFIARGHTVGGDALFDLLDRANVYRVMRPKDSDRLQVVSEDAHGLGVCPMVRFRDRLDGEAVGIVRPLLNLQDRINEAVFSLMIALQFASFRQRWATGLAIPTDEDPFLDAQGKPSATDSGHGANPNFGKPIQPFQAAVDRLWVSDSAEAKFGDFSQTEVSGHLNAYDSAVRTLAAIAQTPPHVLLGDLVNLSADALAAAEASTQRKAQEYETIFGESWEQAFRLAALAAGDTATAQDTSAQVRWRDTEARSLAQTVDALGKMSQMLLVPAEALWERIPGVTDQDVNRWKEMAGRADGLSAIAAALTRQQAPASAAVDTSHAPAIGPGTSV